MDRGRQPAARPPQPGPAGDLGLTKTDYAIIINIFTFAYAFGQSLFGKIFDWIGTRLGFVLAIGVWSLATILHAVAHSMVTFSLFRGLLGLSEAGNWPGATKANAEWFGLDDPTEVIGKDDFDFFKKEHALRQREEEEWIMETGKPVIAEEQATSRDDDGFTG